MDSLFKIIGERIAKKRKELKLSQEQLADIVKVHRNYIGSIERAEKKATVETLFKIAKALEITLEELFKNIKY